MSRSAAPQVVAVVVALLPAPAVPPLQVVAQRPLLAVLLPRAALRAVRLPW